MTFHASDYHPSWPDIRRQINDQAGNCCERCGAPNGTVGDHDRDGRWWPIDDLIHAFGMDDWRDVPGYLESFASHTRPVRIVLTTAHACQDKRCIDPGHLFALCQLHHFEIDRQHHLDVQRENRRQRRIEQGQLALIGVMP